MPSAKPGLPSTTWAIDFFLMLVIIRDSHLVDTEPSLAFLSHVASAEQVMTILKACLEPRNGVSVQRVSGIITPTKVRGW